MAKKTVAVVEEDDDDVELEELTEDADETPAKAKAKKADDDVWGVRALIKLIKEKTDKDYSPREVRTLLRKLAREGGGVDREIVAGNKSRYSWSGPKDPEVLTVLKAVKGGAIEAAKTAALDKLKSDKAAKQAAKAKEDARAAKKAAAKKAAEDDEDEDD